MCFTYFLSNEFGSGVRRESSPLRCDCASAILFPPPAPPPLPVFNVFFFDGPGGGLPAASPLVTFFKI